MSSPACSACGSTRIRRARMREGWHQWAKKHTRWRRYACGECQHRGWTRAHLPHSDHPEEQDARLQVGRQLPGRPTERRDHRARREWRVDVSRKVVVAIGLGTLIALLIGLISRK